MKKLIYIITILILTTLIHADSIFKRDSLTEGEGKAYELEDGIYILKSEIISNEKEVKFRLNGEISETLVEGESHIFKDRSEIVVKEVLVSDDSDDEVSYYFYGSGKSPLKIDISTKNLDIDKCDFDKSCDEDEDKEDCCYDCGCNSGFRCTDNKCVKTTTEGCINNQECNDQNPCTLDTCNQGKCEYEPKKGCPLDNKCVEEESAYRIDNIPSYCLDGWNPQKEKDKACEKDYECLSKKCKKNKCYEKSSEGFALVTIFVLALIIALILLKSKRIRSKLFGRKPF